MFRMSVFAALFAAFAFPAGAVPFAYELDKDGGDGSVTVSQPAGNLMIELVASDQYTFPEFGPAVWTSLWLTYTGSTPFRMAVDWTFSTLDPYYWGDYFGYYTEYDYDSVEYLTFGSEMTESGQFEFEVQTGSKFGFFIHSVDDCCGRATATVTVTNVPLVSNPHPSPVPLPATAALLLPALGALRLVRRRARA